VKALYNVFLFSKDMTVWLMIKIINSNISGQRNYSIFMSIIIVCVRSQIILINRFKVLFCSGLYKVVSSTI
jgi:hypothetical protein